MTSNLIIILMICGILLLDTPGKVLGIKDYKVLNRLELKRFKMFKRFFLIVERRRIEKAGTKFVRDSVAVAQIMIIEIGERTVLRNADRLR